VNGTAVAQAFRIRLLPDACESTGVEMHANIFVLFFSPSILLTPSSFLGLRMIPYGCRSDASSAVWDFFLLNHPITKVAMVNTY